MLSIDGLLSANFAATAATHTDGKQQHQLSAQQSELELQRDQLEKEMEKRSLGAFSSA